jgi:hypothetical protein
MKEVHVLQPRQRVHGHRPDPLLDTLITNHRRRHSRRFAMLGIDHRALLGRRLSTTTPNTWSTK